MSEFIHPNSEYLGHFLKNFLHDTYMPPKPTASAGCDMHYIIFM